ncbi:hypothetical protein BOTBODRAFT_536422 [Botryobasidium botryosum FD-172 SS1]|uniref:Uncharacterized protein n=1 Tax=Botryobasidium botryosum (strain FD-172 SS1) TaxID=930990 RepID=A0A067MC08_BOTB1|nr:hypothetical protein BOTBODRAFT_536422 [Botryobasidium botryosum FD-172 SS1]
MLALPTPRLDFLNNDCVVRARPPTPSKIICIASHCFSLILYKKNNFPASLFLSPSGRHRRYFFSLGIVSYPSHHLHFSASSRPLVALSPHPPTPRIYLLVAGTPYPRTPVVTLLSPPPTFPPSTPRLSNGLEDRDARIHCTTRASSPYL